MKSNLRNESKSYIVRPVAMIWKPIRETKSTKEHFTRPAITLIKA